MDSRCPALDPLCMCMKQCNSHRACLMAVRGNATCWPACHLLLHAAAACPFHPCCFIDLAAAAAATVPPALTWGCLLCLAAWGPPCSRRGAALELPSRCPAPSRVAREQRGGLCACEPCAPGLAPQPAAVPLRLALPSVVALLCASPSTQPAHTETACLCCPPASLFQLLFAACPDPLGLGVPERQASALRL